MTISLSSHDTAEAMGKEAAQVYAAIIRQNNRAGKFTNLGFPTGGTPVPFYAELVRLHREEGLDFSKVRSFNLDEYIDLDPKHAAQSYHQFMEDNLFEPLRSHSATTCIQETNIHFPDPDRAEAYDDLIAEHGGLDACAGGIGSDGHVAFIEPEDDDTPDARRQLSESKTQVVRLQHQTIKDNSRFFSDDESQVPKTAVSMGIATMRAAKIFVLLATGEHKAAILKAALEDEISAKVPASFLQDFTDLRVFFDAAAGTQLTLTSKPAVSDASRLAQAYSVPAGAGAGEPPAVLNAVTHMP